MLAVIQLFMVVVSLRVGWAFGSELQQSLGLIGWILGMTLAIPAAMIVALLRDRSRHEPPSPLG